MATPKKLRGKIGVIGLGIIGTRVAANLRSAGHQVYVWSRTPRAAPNFLGSVVEVADLCDVIELFVSDDRALQEVIRTVAAALRPRHVVLCHATVSPEATRHAAGIVESQGARYLDAPFTGSKAAAQNKQLVYYIGGARPALEEVRPVLEATSKAILHVGGIGDASVLKIATNMLTASTVQTLAEALALVRAAGIDGSKLVEALENNASRSGTSDLKLPAMIAANAEPNFSLKHMLKDVRFAQELADKYQLSLPLTDTTAEVFALGMQNDWGDKDFSVVAQLYPAPPPPSIVPKPVEPLAAPAPTVAPAVVVEKSVPEPVKPPATAPEKSTTEPVKPSTSAPEKSVVEPVKPPALISEKPAVEPVKTPAPTPKDSPVELTLPPRPDAAPKSVIPELPAGEGEPTAEKLANSSVAEIVPPETKHEPEIADKKAGPVTADASKKTDVPPVGLLPPKPSDVKKDESRATDAPKKPEALASADVPAPKTEEPAKQERKTTFRFLRGFFKPVPTEPR